MGYNSISCPKCGVDLSIEESMRGTKVTCPSCNHQMHVPTYTEENIPVVDPSAIRTYIAPAPEPETKTKTDVSQIFSCHSFTIGVVALLIILVASFAVNAMLLISLTSVKTIIRAQDERNKKAELLAEQNKQLNNAAKWEYKIVCVNGEQPASNAEKVKGNLLFPQKNIESAVKRMGEEKWTLCNVLPLSETVFTNISEDKLIPQFVPNTRTSGLILIFSRPKQN